MSLNAGQSYDDFRENFAWDLPENFNFGRDVVDMWAETADKDALIWANTKGDLRTFKFSDVSRLSNQVANLLASRGVKRGDRVIVMLPRIPEWQISLVACLKLGAIPIPSVSMLTEKDVAYRIAHSEATAIITTQANAEKIPADSSLQLKISADGAPEGWLDFDLHLEESVVFEAASMELEDPVLMFYTSGSTGKPKGVMHCARGMFAWPVAIRTWMKLTSDDLLWCTADTGWSKAVASVLVGPWAAGASIFMYDGNFDPSKRIELIAKFGVTVFCATTTEFRHIVQIPPNQFKVGRLRLGASGGESVNPEIVAKWNALSSTPLLECYGMTETLIDIINTLDFPIKAGSIGKSSPGTESVVISYANRIAADGEVGQLALKLPVPQIMLGYYKDAKKTEESMTTLDGVKYWLTGDLAYRDSDGYFFFSGRPDDIIKSAGYKIGPGEVESALIEHPAVLETAVVASPDAERGEIVTAYIVLRPGYSRSDALVKEIQDHTKRVTAPYMYPRMIRFVDVLPKSPVGKILRRVLRDQEFALSAAGSTGNK